MPKLNEDQKFELLQVSSGNFFTVQIPDDWETMSTKNQDEWMHDHTWELLENVPVNDVWDNVTACYEATLSFIDNL